MARLNGGKIERFGTSKGVPNADVRVLYQDRAGTVWAGTKSGLARFNGTGFTVIRDAGAPL